ncbi:hypothetical protein OTK49_01495 [Vibrio coralliirubri]|uniref:hypothetical protein n=1 Tax=Vibrio coralliirubri TaxID=1516159 RepID=UPI002283B3DA|nr:hypothetical protein [Vibrio coralliirubri]MCY9861199.1 hypothetical protein [Vibrio coralliirubri]
MNNISFDEARQRLDDGKEVWFCVADHSGYNTPTLAKNILPTRLGNFDTPTSFRLFGKDVIISRRYYLMGNKGKAIKKNYIGYVGSKPIALYRSKQECSKAYNEMLNDAITTLKNSITRLDNGVKLFESLKLNES